MRGPNTHGAPPKHLTGRMPVSSQDSPWWDRVASEITANDGMVGRTLSIEDLTQIVPSYPDGRRPRPRAVARRLRSILELIERGPNGSLGRGATYRIKAPPAPIPDASPHIQTDEIPVDTDWISESIRRMTGG